MPSGLAYLLMTTGLISRLIRPLHKLSWPLLATGAVITLVFSCGKVASALMSPLEYRWPPVTDARTQQDAQHIVVLTGWASDDADWPLSGRLNISSAYRVLMALELWEQRPELDLIVSGTASTARIMAEVIKATGVPADKVRIEDKSLSTAESAAFLKPFVGEAPFFLVTSAGHLPRSMAAMHKQGLAPVPAPTDHKLPRDWRRAELQPRPDTLGIADLAIHEYLGMLWYRLRGKT
jgi:uncharacterized SAM-binding protein YcdF (DUF218 family)